MTLINWKGANMVRVRVRVNSVVSGKRIVNFEVEMESGSAQLSTSLHLFCQGC